ncbi:MAG: hypothetical protein JW986_05955 [Methanotrichaceae archaeon]|nr:hypothetical protein [Methanotrichaceae archaeon]
MMHRILAVLSLALLLSVQGEGTITGAWDIRLDIQGGEGPFSQGFKLALDEREDAISGTCQVEVPEQWTGPVTGEAQGATVDLMAVAYRTPAIMIRLYGQADDDLMEGMFVAADLLGGSWYGSFIGRMLSDDPAFLFQGGADDEGGSDVVTSGTSEVRTVPAVQGGQEASKSRFYPIHYTRDTVYPRPVL